MMETCKGMDPTKKHALDVLEKNYASFKKQFVNAVDSSKQNCNGILNVDREHAEKFPAEIKKAQLKLINTFDGMVKEEHENQKKHENPKDQKELHVVGEFICKLNKEVDDLNSQMNDFVGKLQDFEAAQKKEPVKKSKSKNGIIGKVFKSKKKTFVEWF